MKQEERVEVWTIGVELVLEEGRSFTNVLARFKELLDEGTLVSASISRESI